MDHSEQSTQSIGRKIQIIQWISRVLASVSAIALGVMMIISVIDVGGCYFFLHPLNGAFELVSLTLVIAATLGVGYCELQKGQIRVLIIIDMFHGRKRTILDILAYLLAVAATGKRPAAGIRRGPSGSSLMTGLSASAPAGCPWPVPPRHGDSMRPRVAVPSQPRHRRIFWRSSR